MGLKPRVFETLKFFHFPVFFCFFAVFPLFVSNYELLCPETVPPVAVKIGQEGHKKSRPTFAKRPFPRSPQGKFFEPFFGRYLTLSFKLVP